MSEQLVDDLYLHMVPGYAHDMSREHIVGSVHRRGQQNATFANARGPYQTIRSILKPVFGRY